MSAACRSCEAPIIFALTAKGHRMPLDAEVVHWDPDGVDERGLFALVENDGVLRAVSSASADAPKWTDAPRHRSHFATCPNASKHRRSRKT